MSVTIIVSEGDREANRLISEACKMDRKIKIVGNAYTGLETISQIMRLKPQVLVVSPNFPDLDIINIIRRTMKQFPIPILVLPSKTDESIVRKITELDIGIIDFLEVESEMKKLKLNSVSLTTRIHILSKLKIEKFREQIRQSIYLTEKRMKKNDNTTKNHLLRMQKRRLLNVSSANYVYKGKGRSSKVVIIGTSTGGPRLLSYIIPKIPRNIPPTIIIQHMPVGFIKSFAERLNRLSEVRVKEAEGGEPLVPGTVFLAPGGFHLELHRVGPGSPRILLTDKPPVNFVKPAIDVTLISASNLYNSGVISVILTGMGSDGFEGSRIVKENGGKVLALRKEDSDIYGMNRSVIEAGFVDEVLSKRDLVMGIIRSLERS